MAVSFFLISLTPFRLEEFRTAVFDMHLDKSSGSDGMNPASFQKYWLVVGQDVFEQCCGLSTVKYPHALNETHVILIPKKDKPDRISTCTPFHCVM
ncbi:hypothetical protein GOBAR_DD27528 [Gossypium barbadense]|nr:hypothetical protein GOBAR_DD27528 [Gossypium barbadense]